MPSSGILLARMLTRSVPSPPLRCLAARGRIRRRPASRASGTAGACTCRCPAVIRCPCSPGRCCRPSRCPRRSAGRCRSDGTSSSRASTWIGKSALIFSTKSNSSFCSAVVDGLRGQLAQEAPRSSASGCAALNSRWISLRSAWWRGRRRSPGSSGGRPSGPRRPPRG